MVKDARAPRGFNPGRARLRMNCLLIVLGTLGVICLYFCFLGETSTNIFERRHDDKKTIISQCCMRIMVVIVAVATTIATVTLLFVVNRKTVCTQGANQTNSRLRAPCRLSTTWRVAWCTRVPVSCTGGTSAGTLQGFARSCKVLSKAIARIMTKKLHRHIMSTTWRVAWWTRTPVSCTGGASAERRGGERREGRKALAFTRGHRPREQIPR